MLSKREQVLWTIAGLYNELVDPLNGPAALRGDGDSVVRMPETYTQTVREYERLVALMRNQAKQQAFEGFSIGTLRWHLVEWHHRSVKVVKHEPVTVMKGKKRLNVRHPDGTPVTRPKVSYIRHKDANVKRAELAIRWMAKHWNEKLGEPMVPQAVLEGYQVAA